MNLESQECYVFRKGVTRTSNIVIKILKEALRGRLRFRVIFQVFLNFNSIRKKLLSYLSVLVIRGFSFLLRKEISITLLLGMWSDKYEGVKPDVFCIVRRSQLLSDNDSQPTRTISPDFHHTNTRNNKCCLVLNMFNQVHLVHPLVMKGEISIIKVRFYIHFIRQVKHILFNIFRSKFEWRYSFHGF